MYDRQYGKGVQRSPPLRKKWLRRLRRAAESFCKVQDAWLERRAGAAWGAGAGTTADRGQRRGAGGRPSPGRRGAVQRGVAVSGLGRDDVRSRDTSLSCMAFDALESQGEGTDVWPWAGTENDEIHHGRGHCAAAREPLRAGSDPPFVVSH
jgi:hypothetical protein